MQQEGRRAAGERVPPPSPIPSCENMASKNRAPIAPHCLLVLLLTACVVVSCLLAPFLKIATDALSSDPGFGHLLKARNGSYDFGRVMRRMMLLLTCAALVVARRRLAIYATVKQAFQTSPRISFVANGWAIGISSVSVVIPVMVAFGAKQWCPQIGSVGEGLVVMAEFTLSAVAVGFIEEALFRAFVLRLFMRRMSTWTAIVLSSLLYAVLHFFAIPVRVHPGFDLLVGFRTVGQFFLPVMREAYVLSHPDLWNTSILPTTLSLALLGIVLAHSYMRSGSIYFSVGLHAGWVFGIKAWAKFVVSTHGVPEWFWGSRKLVNGVVGSVFLMLTWLFIVAAYRDVADRPQRPSACMERE